MEPSGAYMHNISYEDFRRHCERVVSMSDNELVSQFGVNADLKEIRMKYQYMLENTGPEEYEKLKSANAVNAHKVKGNNYFSQGKFGEAIQEYSEGLGHLEEILDPEIKDAAETSLRLNLAMAAIKSGKYTEAIKECIPVLEKEPYNVRAIYRIALAYKEIGDKEKAAEYLRRVVIRKSTDEKLIKLYEEVVPATNYPLVEQALKHLTAKDKPALKEEFNKQGLVISEADINELLLLSPTPAALKEKIAEFDRKRRYEQFLKYPIMDDLLEDPMLLTEVERVVANKESNFTKRMLGTYKGLTHDQLKEAVKGIRMRVTLTKILDYLPSKKTFTIFLGAIIVIVISYLLYKEFNK